MMTLYDKHRPVTQLLLLVTSLLFFVMQVVRFGTADTAQTVYDFGGLYGEALRFDWSQIWRLFTPIFVHIGWEHFLFNSLTLYVFGSQLEPLFGSKRFLLLYVLAGLMGNAFVLFFTPEAVTAGASTSLFGLFGAMGLLRYYSQHPYIRLVGQRYLALLLVNLVLNLFTPSVSLAGHVGGMIGGILVVIFLPPLQEDTLFSPKQKIGALLAYLALFSCLLFFALIG